MHGPLTLNIVILHTIIITSKIAIQLKLYTPLPVLGLCLPVFLPCFTLPGFLLLVSDGLDTERLIVPDDDGRGGGSAVLNNSTLTSIRI